jgi:hypothetical protein
MIMDSSLAHDKHMMFLKHLENDEEEEEDEFENWNPNHWLMAPEMPDVPELPPPIIDELQTAITFEPLKKGCKNRSYWIQVPLYAIHEDQRHKSILDNLTIALQGINTCGYIGVQQARVNSYDCEPKLYWMLYVKATVRKDVLTAACILKALANSKLTNLEKGLLVVGKQKGRSPHSQIRTLYNRKKTVNIEESGAGAAVEVENTDSSWKRKYEDTINVEKRKWARLEYDLAKEITAKAARLSTETGLSVHDCEQKIKADLLKDTGAVFITRGEAAAKVFEKQTAFADLSLQKNMTAVITDFWRLQPEYDARRFDFHRLGKATAAEKAAFETAEAKHIAQLETKHAPAPS